ncbi:cellulose biosynthesis protein BcsD [Bordetella hinzii]|uniref:Cellulose synthase subunit D n=1 Tax=Bordetella hinzii OH87 BAL007II TaxID=1331262 RepID=A0ABR4R2I9_9BORD|nr:cellulose biosynthesis protein BcsD [Bordetella hinzii]KCB24963.1 cellulose synthase subunit D [Bordetella hinzii OH87 BAL007II]KCB28948.1 cellulose synthase subunit D [Bordetella hinzii CA90 BAL1384]KCB44308.1 cellulose synthase subunit D [Bordetella hinzii 5132]
MQSAILSHLDERLCASQWRDVLAAFAQELAQDLTAQRLRALMRRTGETFAARHVLPQAASVADMQSAINQVWRSLDWGWVEIAEAEDHLALAHHCAPLRGAFGDSHLVWSTGFLEGAYESWMRRLGADAQLRVTQQQASDELGTIVYRFGR